MMHHDGGLDQCYSKHAPAQLISFPSAKIESDFPQRHFLGEIRILKIKFETLFHPRPVLTGLNGISNYDFIHDRSSTKQTRDNTRQRTGQYGLTHSHTIIKNELAEG